MCSRSRSGFPLATLFVLASVGVVGCGGALPQTPVPPVTSTISTNAVIGIVQDLPAPPPVAAVDAHGGVPWIEDDYVGARDQAKRDKKLVFADAWATWCHSCVSMRAFVLHDPSLAPLAANYVFASVDTEREQNGKFVNAFTPRVWPTLLVIDPETDKVILRWEGTLAADELSAVLGDVKTMAGSGNELAPLLGPEASHDAIGAYLKKHQEPGLMRDHLVDRYTTAACNAPGGKPGEKLSDKQLEKASDACVRGALEELPRMTEGTLKWAVLTTALGGAEHASPDLRERTVNEAEKLLATPRVASARVQGDDVSGVFEGLCDHYDATKQGDKKRALATRWATFLEGEAEKAPTPQARAVFDAHRLLAYLALKEPVRALPMLQKSASDMPDDYNPHARLARVYKELGRIDDALHEVVMAEKVGYGPRMLRVAALGADLHEAKGDRDLAKREIDEALAKLGDAPLPGGYKRAAADLRTRSAALALPAKDKEKTKDGKKGGAKKQKGTRP